MEGNVVNSSENIEAKIVILGEQSESRLYFYLVGIDNLMEFLDVGKTSFVVVFNPEGSSEGRNKLNCVSSTIGASFVTCRVRVKEKSVRMQVGVSVASLLLQSN